MAHAMAATSGAPPVWVRGTVHEIANSGISSGTSHFVDRGTILCMYLCLWGCVGRGRGESNLN